MIFIKIPMPILSNPSTLGMAQHFGHIRGSVLRSPMGFCAQAGAVAPAPHAYSGQAQRLVMALKDPKGFVVLPQAQDPLPGVRDHAGGPVDDFLDHGFDASALGAVEHGAFTVMQGVLADQAKQVHGHGGELADEVVGSNLPEGSRSRPISVLNSA